MAITQERAMTSSLPKRDGKSILFSVDGVKGKEDH